MFSHQWLPPTSSDIPGHDPHGSAYRLPVSQIVFKSMTSAPPRGPIGRGDLAFPFLRPAQPLPPVYMPRARRPSNSQPSSSGLQRHGRPLFCKYLTEIL